MKQKQNKLTWVEVLILITCLFVLGSVISQASAAVSAPPMPMYLVLYSNGQTMICSPPTEGVKDPATICVAIPKLQEQNTVICRVVNAPVYLVCPEEL